MAHSLVRVEHVMGMAVSLDLDDDLPVAELERLADGVFGWLRLVDEVFSTYRPESEISRLGRGELRREQCAPMVGEVLDRCAELWTETGGFFDINAGGTLDPSGFVKGWAVERAAALLAAAGARNLCVHAGGDVRVRGERAPGEPWRVGVQHPAIRDRVAAVLAGRDLAVATSGAYERGAHVVDPRTGRAPRGVLSVTVAGPDLGTADAYATAAFAMGLDGPAWTATLGGGYEALTILAGGRVLSTPGLAALRAD